MKCPLPLGWLIGNLVLSATEFKAAYLASGTYSKALNIIQWGVDWMVKSHLTASDSPLANVFVGQVRGDNTSTCGSTCNAPKQAMAALVHVMQPVCGALAPPRHASSCHCSTASTVLCRTNNCAPHNPACTGAGVHVLLS